MTLPRASCIGALAAMACYGPADPGACPAMEVPAVVVSITDSIGTQSRAAIASGEVQDGAYVDALRNGTSFTDDSLRRAAAIGRPGTYTVRVRAPGYQNWQRAGVAAASAGCFPATAFIAAKLQPVP